MKVSYIFNYILVFELVLNCGLSFKTAKYIGKYIQVIYMFTVALVELSIFYGIYLTIIDIVSIHRVVI